MTREEIKNTPKIVDCLISESVMSESKEKLHKRLDEICNLAIKALEQDQKEIYAKGFADGQRALAEHIELCKEEQEPTTKNDKVDCKHTDCNNCVNHKYCDYESTTKNDLGVE